MNFNVRIQNKYDTLANWNASNLVLNAGEIALATVDTKSADGSQYVPTVLMKVGDGSKTFSQLPWAAARAADVYAWAKKENPTLDDLPSNLKKLITDLQSASDSGVDTKILAAIQALDVTDTAVTGQFVTAVSEVDGKIAVTRDALAASDIPALEISKITNLQDALDGKVAISTYNAKIAEIQNGDTINNFSAVETAISNIESGHTLVTGDTNGTVKFKGTDVAVKGLGSAAYRNEDDFATATQGTKADSAVQSITINGHELKNGGSITVEQTKEDLGLGTAAYANTTDFATSAQGAKADSAVQAVAIAEGTENGKIKLTVDGTATEASVHGLGSAAFTDAGAYATAAQGGKADSAVQKVTVLGKELADGGSLSVDEAKTALGLGGAAYKAEDYYATAQALANTKSELLGDATTAVAGDATIQGALKAAAVAQSDVNTLTGVVNTLRDGIDAEKVDGVKDLIDYVEEHGPEVEGMKKDISDNAAAIEAEAILARANEEALEGRLDVLEAINHDAYIAADNALKAELQKEIDDDVKDAIDAEILRADAAYDATGAAATAKSEAIAAAKTETENQVKALADGAVAENAAEIAKIVNGEVTAAKAADADKLGGQVAANYLLKSEAPGYADILTKTDAKAGYKKVQTAVTEKGAANKTLKISQDTQGVIATEEVDIAITATQVSGLAAVATSGKINDLTQTENTVLVFNCGTATTVI